MNRHKIILTLTFLIASWTLYGQANLAQTEISKIYQQGLELFEKGKYNLAFSYFEKYIQFNEGEEFAPSQIELANAEYYKAVCALKSHSAIAEKLLLDYIEEYSGTGKIYYAYFHLGNFYFESNNYKDALKYYQLTEKELLADEEKDQLTFNKGFSYFALKDFSQAYSQLMPLTQNPTHAYYNDAVYYSGLSAYYLEKYDSALNNFKLLENSTKYKNTVPYYIASILSLKKQYSEMIAYLEPIIENSRNLRYSNEVKKLLGNAYFEEKNYQLAEKYLGESLPKLSKVNQEDLYQLGYVYYKNEEYSKAIEQLKKLSTLDNEMVQSAMFILGQSYSQIGDRGGAKAAFQQAARMKYSDEITEVSSFNIAKITYDQSNYTEALILLKNFVQNYPSSSLNTEAQNLLADVFFRTRSYEEAIGLIEKMKNPTPSIQAAYQKMSYYRAMEYYSNQQMDNSDQYLDKALKYTSDRGLEALTYYWKADIAHLKDQYDISNQWLSKFQSIAATVSTDNSSRVSSATGFYLQGYNSYKKKDFISSQILFAKAIDRLKNEKDPVIQQTVYPDAILRLADSYYMQKKYADALTQYNQVIQTKAKGADYATYQSGMMNGLTGNADAKINVLNELYKNYPNSTYADDALFELGNTYNNVGKSSNAVNAFQTLLKNYPKSEFVPFAYNRIALIQYNQGDLEAALSSYKYVIQKYPKTSASQEALLAVKDIYIDKGDPNGYFELMKQYPGAMISSSAQDSIVYQSAENQFVKGNYEAAIKGLDTYLNNYSNGAFVLPARFYRAESKFYSKLPGDALQDYVYVINQPTNKFTEKSLNRAANITYQNDEYTRAVTYFESLKEMASTEDLHNEALLGAMRSYFYSKNYTKTSENSDKVLNINGLSENEKIEATFYRGISQFYLNNYSVSAKDLESVIQRINNEWAAQSKYTLALMAYNEKNPDKSEKLCFEYISTYPSYPEWMIKTYLLLSDVYVQKSDYFKAKATLQSVIDNYKTKDALYQEAVDKLNKINELETQNSKIHAPNGTSGFSEFEK